MIFGILNSKFEYDDTIVQLENSVFNPNYIVEDEIEDKSILTGTKYYYNRGDDSEFQLNLYLFKYDNPEEKYREIFQYRNLPVTFYPHKDGGPVRDRNGNSVPFIITNLKPFYLTQDATFDGVQITFKSTVSVSYFASASYGYGSNYAQYYGLGL